MLSQFGSNDIQIMTSEYGKRLISLFGNEIKRKVNQPVFRQGSMSLSESEWEDELYQDPVGGGDIHDWSAELQLENVWLTSTFQLPERPPAWQGELTGNWQRDIPITMAQGRLTTGLESSGDQVGGRTNQRRNQRTKMILQNTVKMKRKMQKVITFPVKFYNF